MLWQPVFPHWYTKREPACPSRFPFVCALLVSVTKRLLRAAIIFMAYSIAMSVVWIFLESPDLAITEAAVGTGITSILFFLTLKKVHEIKGTHDE